MTLKNKIEAAGYKIENIDENEVVTKEGLHKAYLSEVYESQDGELMANGSAL